MCAEAETFKHASLTSIPEAELVRRLLTHQFNRADLLGIHSIPSDPLTLTQVSLTALPGSPKGDVDVLACAQSRPEEAVAFEAKRFKVVVEGGSWDRPNKLHEFPEGVRQANLLAQVGFCQVYLWVLVVVDSRKQNAGRVSYAGMSSELRSEVASAITTCGLDPRIGVVQYELVQPMDNAPLTVGAGVLHLVQLAKSTIQPEEVTAWVVARLAEHGAA
jgi:hypothetical protein